MNIKYLIFLISCIGIITNIQANQFESFYGVDSAGNKSSNILADLNTSQDIEGPNIEVWHGLSQKVGHLGEAQDDFNVLGNISDTSGLNSFTYSLNGDTPVPLNVGDRAGGFGDGRRLASTGDFNADIPITNFISGNNAVLLSETDGLGNVTNITVNIDYQSGDQELPVTIDWSAISDPQDAGQYVDGEWTIENGGLRIMRTGYDRLFLIGNKTWRDYEVLIPVTINRIDPPGPVSGGQGLGLIMRFTGHITGGHRNWPVSQPKWGYQPIGAIGWLRWNGPQKQLYRGDFDTDLNFGLYQITVGGTYWIRMRCETLPDQNGEGVTKYYWKIWESGDTEPVNWDIEYFQSSLYALREGGVALVAHHIDATFGNISITDIPDISLPVTLTSFNGKVIDRVIQLNWSTENEINNIGFELLRSDSEIDNYTIISSYKNHPSLIGALNSSEPNTYTYTDSTVTYSKSYFYKLVSVSTAGEREAFGSISISLEDINQTQISSSIPNSFDLYQNYPNPFNSSTKISFTVNSPDNEMGEINIFNNLGQKIRSLFSGILPPGQYKFRWDGNDNWGNPVATGIYYAELRYGKSNQTIKMILQR